MSKKELIKAVRELLKLKIEYCKKVNKDLDLEDLVEDIFEDIYEHMPEHYGYMLDLTTPHDILVDILIQEVLGGAR